MVSQLMWSDQFYLKKAVEVGNQIPAPYNFGAVVVKDGEILSIEHNHVQDENDPTRHAEVSAIVAACKKLGSHHIDSAVLYASHEPCMMCLACASWAHVSRIVYATPASEQQSGMYELKYPNIEALAAQLIRPIKIEQVSVENI